MQSTGVTSFRYKGYRLSRQLVFMAKAGVSDLGQLSESAYSNLTDSDSQEAYLEQLSLEQVSELQHLRAQLRYRLRRYL